MKSYVKGVITGTIITAMATASVASLAESVEVFFNKIKVTVNGQPVYADNVLINGKTYVPLRAISEILNKEVLWDGQTSTAAINDKKAPEIPQVKPEKITLNQTNLIPDFCEFKIAKTEFTQVIKPPNGENYFLKFENNNKDNIFLNTVIDIKNLQSKGKDADEFLSVTVKYANKFEYTTKNTIEEDGGKSLTYTNITSIEPLKNERIHFYAEVPKEVETSGKPIEIIIQANKREYSYNLQ